MKSTKKYDRKVRNVKKRKILTCTISVSGASPRTPSTRGSARGLSLLLSL